MSTPISSRRAAALFLVTVPLARPLGAQMAQQVAATASDSVEVRRGDTLWGLAATRLGSPFRWPEIREANAERIADPHWIYPGQRLRLPGDATAVAAPATTAQTERDEVAPTAFPSTAFADAPAPAPTPVAPPPAAPRAGWPALDTASRLLVHISMPYVGERGELAGAGTVVDDADLAARTGATARRRFGVRDRVVVTLPRGDAMDAALGQSVVLVRRGPDVGGRPVIVPTAIARVDGVSGDFVTARLDYLFDGVETGQQVLSAHDLGFRASAGTHASTRLTRVEWIAGSAELPTVGSVVILGSGAADQVGPDDRFELLGPDRRIGNGVLRGTRVAVVRVMRVTEHTSTAIVVSQEQPAIHVGMTARPIAQHELRATPGDR